MRWLVDIAYFLAGLAYVPVVLYQAVFQEKNRCGWRERFGFVRTFVPTRRRVWIHGVSLGEINATPRLVETIRQRLPDADIVISSTTDTGFSRAVQLYGTDHVFRFPLDFSFVVRRVLRRVRPDMLVLVELEVWHNLVRMATTRGIPVVVVNGRLTERSARRLRRLGRPIRAMFGDLAWVGAQDEEIAGRFRSLGVATSRIEVTSSLKWDSAAVTDRAEGADALGRALGFDGTRPLWVCGSTGPGEEAIILDAYQQLLHDGEELARCVQAKPVSAGRERGAVSAAEPARAKRPRLAIVPRKPERFDEVARQIERAGFSCVRRSATPDGGACGMCDDHAVVLGDTMGELRKFYSLADVVFVGRTLVPFGGSDPMEVAAMAKPLVVGPYTENFRLPVRALTGHDACRVVRTGRELASVVGMLLRDRELAKGLASRARQVVIDQQGATRRTANALCCILEKGAGARSALAVGETESSGVSGRGPDTVPARRMH